MIDREIAGTITLEEAADLERLQQEMYAYRERVAPLSLDDLRKLHAELLEKAARAEGYLQVSPFRYPRTAIQRRHGPQGYAGY